MSIKLDENECNQIRYALRELANRRREQSIEWSNKDASLAAHQESESINRLCGKILPETSELSTEAKLRNILEHLLVRPDLLSDSMYRNQIATAIGKPLQAIESTEGAP